MRILHLIHSLQTAGAETLLGRLVAEQKTSDVTPSVLAWKRGGPVFDELCAAGVDARVCPPGVGSLPGTRRWLLEQHDRIAPDVIHAHMPDSSFWAAILSQSRGTPFVVSYYSNQLLFHTIDRKGLYGRLRWLLVKWGAARACANVACANSVRDRLVEDLGLEPDAIDVVFNGVPLPPAEVAEQACRDRARRQQPPTVVTIGRLARIKGQYQLNQCAPRLLQRFPDARIFVVGDGPERAAWAKQAVELGVQGSIVYTGRVDDVEEYLRLADVYVSPSRYEGISLGLLEAIASGVPVIASEVPGNVDVISHGVDGLLYPFDDASALADTIASVFDDPAAANDRARAARRRVDENFSVATMCRGYRAVYERCKSDR